MTFEQIKFATEIIKKFENQRKDTCYEAMFALLEQTRFYFDEIDFQQLPLKTYRNNKNLTQEDFVQDANIIIYTLKGILAKDKNYSTIKNIIKDIEVFKKCKSDKAIKGAIKKIYYTYSSKIKFSKAIDKIIIDDNTNNDLIDFRNNAFDHNLLDGMIRNLEDYANEICAQKTQYNEKKERQQTHTININNNNNFNPNINFDIAITNANEELKKANLSKEEEEQVKEKIEELETIIKSKESKKDKWKKVGSVLKWLTEQTIAVASIVLPILPCICK